MWDFDLPDIPEVKKGESLFFTPRQIEPGDTVRIGKGKVNYVVIDIDDDDGLAKLRKCENFNRKKYIPVKRLTVVKRVKE